MIDDELKHRTATDRACYQLGITAELTRVAMIRPQTAERAKNEHNAERREARRELFMELLCDLGGLRVENFFAGSASSA